MDAGRMERVTAAGSTASRNRFPELQLCRACRLATVHVTCTVRLCSAAEMPSRIDGLS
jgi:hypothetical protein